MIEIILTGIFIVLSIIAIGIIDIGTILDRIWRKN